MKYKNKRVREYGQAFDSKKEAARYGELLLLQKQGYIKNLICQRTFILIPSQYEETENGKKGRCIERPVKYIADFTYDENGKLVVEDTKGFKTKDYIIKRKLMLYKFGIKIKEV